MAPLRAKSKSNMATKWVCVCFLCKWRQHLLLFSLRRMKRTAAEVSLMKVALTRTSGVRIGVPRKPLTLSSSSLAPVNMQQIRIGRCFIDRYSEATLTLCHFISLNLVAKVTVTQPFVA